MPDVVLSQAEIAERFGVSLSTVRRLVASGDLRAFHVGRQVRILSSEADRYVTRQMKAGAR